MKEINIDKIKEFYESPIIGVIGATVPSKDYESTMGIQTGYGLRKMITRSGGSIFTGGVQGVGVDVYSGIIRFCIENATKTGKMIDDNFFVLIPHFAPVMNEAPAFLLETQVRLAPYNVPTQYELIARFTASRELGVVRAGHDMDERREYVAKVADMLVVVNGGHGTLDEALNALQLGKRIVTVATTGGSARLLSDLVNGNISEQKKAALKKVGLFVDNVDTSKICCVDSLDELPKHLGK